MNPLHGLVNNAGYGLTGAVEDVGDDEVHQVLETMVVAPVRLARLALDGMRSAGGGRRALTSPLPRSRYLVGADACLLAAASDLTPTVVMDRVMRLAQRL